ncbi:hypothetical protein [Brachybacterium sillae]|nr:hypothetical protein [Brachybacterium sillae]
MEQALPEADHKVGLASVHCFGAVQLRLAWLFMPSVKRPGPGD